MAAFVKGLPSVDRTTIVTHLAFCERCLGVYDEMRSTVSTSTPAPPSPRARRRWLIAVMAAVVITTILLVLSW